MSPIPEQLPTTAMQNFAAEWPEEEPALAAARERAAEVGLEPVGAGAGALLRFLAGVVRARAVVEVGTGVGMSAVWLLRGMRGDGVLTTVDVEGEHQRLARETLADAGFPASRARLITGQASDVLPRLTDGGYDLVVVHARAADYAGYLGEALRLLRPGGVVALVGVLRGRVAESGSRDADSVALRELLAGIRDDERLLPVLLPISTGVLAAVVR